jgi:hypothetical protein
MGPINADTIEIAIESHKDKLNTLNKKKSLLINILAMVQEYFCLDIYFETKYCENQINQQEKILEYRKNSSTVVMGYKPLDYESELIKAVDSRNLIQDKIDKIKELLDRDGIPDFSKELFETTGWGGLTQQLEILDNQITWLQKTIETKNKENQPNET